ncbi:MAG: hypothetical protein ACR2NN_21230 [Bryobacteraceae bacterium]
MAFSELEPSQMDPGLRGKRLWVSDGGFAGELTTFEARSRAIEQFSARIEVEPYAANKTYVYLVARMRSDRPQEIAFSVYHHSDSVPIDELTLTATMGNFERLRYLWLN